MKKGHLVPGNHVFRRHPKCFSKKPSTPPRIGPLPKAEPTSSDNWRLIITLFTFETATVELMNPN